MKEIDKKIIESLNDPDSYIKTIMSSLHLGTLCSRANEGLAEDEKINNLVGEVQDLFEKKYKIDPHSSVCVLTLLLCSHLETFMTTGFFMALPDEDKVTQQAYEKFSKDVENNGSNDQ